MGVCSSNISHQGYMNILPQGAAQSSKQELQETAQTIGKSRPQRAAQSDENRLTLSMLPSFQESLQSFTFAARSSIAIQDTIPADMFKSAAMHNNPPEDAADPSLTLQLGDSSTPSEYQCKECGRLLSSRESLYSHMIRHQGRTYSCQICEKAFNHPSNLRQHMRAVHEEKRFECLLCGKRFSTNQKYQFHQTVHK